MKPADFDQSLAQAARLNGIAWAGEQVHGGLRPVPNKYPAALTAGLFRERLGTTNPAIDAATLDAMADVAEHFAKYELFLVSKLDTLFGRIAEDIESRGAQMSNGVCIRDAERFLRDTLEEERERAEGDAQFLEHLRVALAWVYDRQGRAVRPASLPRQSHTVTQAECADVRADLRAAGMANVVQDLEALQREVEEARDRGGDLIVIDPPVGGRVLLTIDGYFVPAWRRVCEMQDGGPAIVLPERSSAAALFGSRP